MPALMLIVVLSSGCGADAPVSEAPSGDADAVATAGDTASSAPPSSINAETSELPESEVVKAYFEAIAQYDIEALTQARETTEPGSVADIYAGYMAASNTADRDSGITPTGRAVEEVDGGYRTCDDPSDDETCATFADITGRAGKLVSFTVDGVKLKPRLLVGDGTQVQVAGSATASLLFAYKTAQGDSLRAIVDVRSKEKTINVGSYEATYRAPNGRQATASGDDNVGTTELSPDSSTTYVMAFPGADLGGQLRLPIYDDSFFDVGEAVISLK